MKLKSTIVLWALGILVVFGCAKKKEEAARLEQELIHQESLAMAESLADARAVPPESEAVESTTSDAGAVPREKTAFEPQEAPGSGFTIQVAACEDLEYARHLIEVFTGRGYEPYLTSTIQDGQTFYRVRIGAFDGYSQAKAVQDELADRYSAPVWIDTID
ncbi:MAG: SPOR domain-containing protein [bacterium]